MVLVDSSTARMPLPEDQQQPIHRESSEFQVRTLKVDTEEEDEEDEEEEHIYNNMMTWRSDQ